ncbi:MAG: hypothetical protein R6U15_01485 [Candidatus Izemoplasmatales bacterium]
MKTQLKILLVGILFSFATLSCEDDNDISNMLLGEWKCVGFGETENNVVREIEPQDCSECYILIFKKDGAVEGSTSTNEVMGEYDINTSTKELKFVRFGGTEINELFDGEEYVEAIFDVYSYEITSTNTLYLYYKQDMFLIYNYIVK